MTEGLPAAQEMRGNAAVLAVLPPNAFLSGKDVPALPSTNLL